MANHDVSMTTFTPTGSMKYIRVDLQAIDIQPGDSITFKNDLTPKADISIQFYVDAKAKATPDPVSGFCGGKSKSFLVAKGKGSTPGEATCNVAAKMDGDVYLYSVSAGSGYHELDPVIIFDRPGFSSLVGLLLFAAAGAAAGAIVTRMYMHSAKRNSSTPEPEAR